MDTNLANIFSDFINDASDELKCIFNKYCLGSECSNAISLKNYITLLRRSFYYRTDLGRRRVVYTRLDSDSYIHKRLLMNSINKPEFIDSIYVATEHWIGKYPDITMINYEYFTGIVFLIHNDVNIQEEDKLVLNKLASAWYDYSIDKILGIRYPKAIYRYANADIIYHSERELTKTELRKLKIYTNRIFGKTKLLYE